MPSPDPSRRAADDAPARRTRAKRSVALVVVDPSADDPRRWLLVRRPPDDGELPGVWGLPAGSFRDGERERDVVERIGRDKLNVELRPGPELATGSADRPGYRLEMRLLGASLVRGTPRVPGRADDVTQYADWSWGPAERLATGAARGSLCCRLALESIADESDVDGEKG
ncbi:MAG: DNA mismatch repair protein MutT [Gemmatimonadetes bacterium]|nr:DNA mismatch repair protein MutT [Gemmatimonadota bacterium]